MHSLPHTPASTPRRICSLVIVLCVLQFIAAALLAGWMYPGGHPWDTDAPGYTFWRNTMSDLGKDIANNGEPATWAAHVFNISTALLAPGFVALWCILPTLLPHKSRMRSWVRWTGLASVAGLVGVAATPADRLPDLHTLTIGLAAIPGLTACTLACVALLANSGSRWLGGLTLTMLAVGMVHFGQYVRHFWLHGPWTRACPAVQKLAVMAALAWMLLVAWQGWTNAPHSSAGGKR